MAFFPSLSSWKLVGVAAAAAVRTDDGQQRDGDPGGVSLDMNYDAFAAHSKARNLDRCLRRNYAHRRDTVTGGK